MASGKFELAFVGGSSAAYFPRYRRRHTSIEAATEEARKVYGKLEDDGYPTVCHAAIVYGPGCGNDGWRIA